MVPTHFNRILQLDAAERRRHDLSSLRVVLHSAAPCPPHVKRGIMEVFPPGSVVEFYGASEGGFTRITAEEWLRKPGSVGRPWPGHVITVIDEQGKECAAGEIGLIYVDAPRMTFQYRGDSEKTARAFRGGAFTAGDLGYLDDDGYLYIADRHPAVADAAVIGLPDSDFGKSVCAVIELRPGMQATAEEIVAFTRQDLAHYKCPRRVEIVGRLPREPQGKVRKHELIQRFTVFVSRAR
jgi:long-chain acyl-CoA synthetase